MTEVTFARERYSSSLRNSTEAMAGFSNQSATVTQVTRLAAAQHMQTEVMWLLMEHIVEEIADLKAAIQPKKR